MCSCVCEEVRRQLEGTGFLLCVRFQGLIAGDRFGSAFTLRHLAAHCFVLGCCHLNSRGSISLFPIFLETRLQNGLNTIRALLPPPHPLAPPGVGVTSEASFLLEKS